MCLRTRSVEMPNAWVKLDMATEGFSEIDWAISSEPTCLGTWKENVEETSPQK